MQRIGKGAAASAALLGLAASAIFLYEAHSAPVAEQHVSMQAMKFDYLPFEVTVKKGIPVELELSTLDRLHGFDAPTLGLHTEIQPGAPTIVHFTPEKAGTYNLHCDVFCGDGHEGMAGRIIVTE
jgi:cytochrome c oxidase subunit 2